jgi:thiamine phosphate synthase YjbQ (UPF0047 family)
MTQVAAVMVKLNGSPELVAALEKVARENPAEVKVQSCGPSNETSHLRLGLAEVSTLVAVVNGVVTFGKFAYAIYEHFKKKGSQEMTVQTPLRTIVILASDATSPEQVQRLLEGSLKP